MCEKPGGEIIDFLPVEVADNHHNRFGARLTPHRCKQRIGLRAPCGRHGTGHVAYIAGTVTYMHILYIADRQGRHYREYTGYNQEYGK